MGNCDSEHILDEAYLPVLGRLGPVADLRIVHTVWLKDYQGLYDYDSKDLRKQVLTVNDHSYMFTEGEKRYIRSVKETNKSQKTMKSALFEIIRKANYYKLMPIIIENEQYMTQKMMWLVVRSVPHQKYPLREKDLLKFGKQKIRVREIVPHDNNPSNLFTEFNTIKTTKKTYQSVRYIDSQIPNVPNKDEPHNDLVSIATESEQTCRVCLQPGQLTNPLICACKCTGSVRYIHLVCLRTWLGKQLNVNKTKHCVSIKWTPLQCQMCKSHYKYRIYLDNKKYYTVEIPKPAKPYIVLEVLVKKNVQYSKIFHFVSMADSSKLSIGRKKDIDIKLSEDISVSRHHANLLYDFQGKRFILEDNKSKFGTLVQVRKNMLVNPPQRGISIQMGGQIFTFQTVRTQGSIPEYYDEQGYLNVVEKGDRKKAQEEESDEEDADDDFDQEDEVPNLANLNLRNGSGIQNNSNMSQMHSVPMIPHSPSSSPLQVHPQPTVLQIAAIPIPVQPQPQQQEQIQARPIANRNSVHIEIVQIQQLDI